MFVVMKKSLLIAALLSVFAILSCTKERPSVPETPANEVAVHFHAVSSDTRTFFGEKDAETNKYPVRWSENDQVKAILRNPGSEDSGQSKNITVEASQDGTTADLSASFEEQATYEFMLVSPAASYKGHNFRNTNYSSSPSIYVEIPATQTPASSGPDPSAQILYSVTEEYTTLPATLPLSFKHATAYMRIRIRNAELPAGAVVQSVDISMPADPDYFLAGRSSFIINQDRFIKSSRTFNTITIMTSSIENIWCGIAPIDLGGKNLTIRVCSDQGIISKQITMPSGSVLGPGDVATFSVNMAGISPEESVEYVLVSSVDDLHWGDEVIIAASDDDYAIGITQNSNNRSGVGINRDGNVIYNPSDVVELITLEDGAIPGTYALHATRTAGYLYAAGGVNNSGNYLRTQNTVDNLASWTITFGNQTAGDNDSPDATRAIIKAQAQNRYLMRYNINDNLFACYGGGTTQTSVKIYRKNVDPDNSLRFRAALTAGTASSDGQVVPVYIFGNVPWTASVSGGATLDAASGNGNGIINVTVPENSVTSPRTFTVTVTTTAAVTPNSYALDITQAAAPSALAVGTVLWAESWTGGAANDTPVAYQARATASTVVYGNASVVYTFANGGSNTKLYTDNIVYVPKESERPDDIPPLPEDGCNLLVGKSTGWWRISGIPCAGVKKATFTIRANYGTAGYFNASTTTSGVTIGTFASSTYVSDWGKTVNVNTYPITFTGTSETFDLKISNTNKNNNVRVDDIDVIVTELL